MGKSLLRVKRSYVYRRSQLPAAEAVIMREFEHSKHDIRHSRWAGVKILILKEGRSGRGPVDESAGSEVAEKGWGGGVCKT